MSSTETHFGKVKDITDVTKTIEEQCKTLIQKQFSENNKNFDDIDYSIYNSFKEWINDEYYEKYLIIKDKIYEILEDEELDESNIFIATKNEDNTINFFVQFYNGGCCLNEAIEMALKNMK